jgi:2-enoate reductase
MYFEPGMYREFGRLMKQTVSVPIILAGRMDDPEMACESLGRDCDLIGLGRPLLADPYWANKVQTGDLADIRPCLSCQQGCLARLAEGQMLSCAVNPACGRERDFALIPTATPKHILVVGGGLAGMEAARVCAIRGHNVELWERSDSLGGEIKLGDVPDFKRDDRALLAWYKRQMELEPVNVKLNKEATKQEIINSGAEIVILATGAVPVRLDFGGKNHVCLADDILSGKQKAGQNVVVVGGGLVGCETGLWLAQHGHHVSVVEAKDKILSGGQGMCFANYDMLKDELAFNKMPVYESSTVDSVQDSSIVLNTPQGKKELPADTVMVAVGYRPDTSLYDSLRDGTQLLYNIGDSRHVHNIMQAIWDGYQLAMNLY